MEGAGAQLMGQVAEAVFPALSVTVTDKVALPAVPGTVPLTNEVL